MKVFETFKPNSDQLQKYISYYYVDIAHDEDHYNEYICYPHFNNTVSLYKSHQGVFTAGHSIIKFEEGAPPLQIFTPLRESILKVTQKGKVYKIGIVFKPFGINQFLSAGIPIGQLLSSPRFNFFEDKFIDSLFQNMVIGNLVPVLDNALLKRLAPVHNLYIEHALIALEAPEKELTIEELTATLGISSRHLNRLFNKYIGTSVQKYRSIVRLRQLMSDKLHKNNHDSLSALSYKRGYADQSHFIRECKLLTGSAPSQLFNEGTILGEEDTFWSFTR